MEPLFAAPSEEDQEILDILEIKEHKGFVLPSLINPNRPAYWMGTFALMGSFHYLRSMMHLYKGPRMYLSVLVWVTPIISIFDHKRVVNQFYVHSSNSLEKNLIVKKDVREAFEEALLINQHYQDSLRAQIAELEQI